MEFNMYPNLHIAYNKYTLSSIMRLDQAPCGSILVSDHLP